MSCDMITLDLQENTAMTALIEWWQHKNMEIPKPSSSDYPNLLPNTAHRIEPLKVLFCWQQIY